MCFEQNKLVNSSEFQKYVVGENVLKEKRKKSILKFGTESRIRQKGTVPWLILIFSVL